MKYIRTKDGRIIAISSKSSFILYDDDKLVIDTTKKGQTCVYGIVDKQADTIEKLCDCLLIPYDIESLMRMKCETAKATIDYYYMNYKYKPNYDIFVGAIWTDKGLIYVAKMNDEGELELL